jgi:predicted nucleotide-binding protein (sugar kinase/HSP70/actin superfamily)
MGALAGMPEWVRNNFPNSDDVGISPLLEAMDSQNTLDMKRTFMTFMQYSLIIPIRVSYG